LQQAGHAVEILEALDVVGGCTRTAQFGLGHHCDTGAGWLASFYMRTLALFDELGGREVLLRPREGHGADGLLVHGRVHRIPFALQAIATSALLTADEKERMVAYVARLRTEQRGEGAHGTGRWRGRIGATWPSPFGPFGPAPDLRWAVCCREVKGEPPFAE
jgi:phytoene dehydrogenase-like protein